MSASSSEARKSPRAASENPSCSVPNCAAEAVRSIALQDARKAFSAIPEGRRAHLCREHYRAYKKATKKDRELRRLGN